VKDIHHRRALYGLGLAVLVAAGLGGYSAVELDKSQTTCQRQNTLIHETNRRGAILHDFLVTAAIARGKIALDARARARRFETDGQDAIAASLRREARINEHAVRHWRADALKISPVAPLGC
jgi:hypothetical protein